MPIPGASNINFSGRTKTPLNLAPTSGGAIVRVGSQSLIPYAEPAVQPASQPPPVNFTNPRALPNLQSLTRTNVIPEPSPTPPKVAPVNAVAPIVGGALSKFAIVTAEGTPTALAAPVLLSLIAAGVWFHNAQELLKLWQLSQPESKPEDLDLNEGEGKGDGIPYLVGYHVHIDYGDGRIVDQDGEQGVWGPVEAIRWFNSFFSAQTEILSRGELGAPYRPGNPTSPSPELKWVGGSPGYAGAQPATVTLTSIRQLDQQGNPIPNAPTDPKPQPQPQRIPSLSPQPLNLSPNQPQPQKQLNNFPERLPFADPEPETKKKPIKFAVPSDQPIQISAPGQPTIQISPQADPEIKKQPTRIVIPTNAPAGAPQPVQVTSPSGTPTTFSAPAGSPITINIPGFKPITYTLGQGQPANTIKPIQAPETLVPESITQPSIPIQKLKPIGSPAAGLQPESRPKVTPETTGTNSKGQPVVFTPPVPATQPTTTPTTTPTPTTPTIPEKDPAKGFIPAPDPVAIALAGLTPILQQIVSQTSQSAIQKAAAAGTCSTTEPGGCTANLVNNAANNINQNTNRNADILGGANALQNAEQLRQLSDITNRLGAQIPGGLSGFLQRAFQATRLDKILNALTFITTLHNAAMLSRSLGSTLGDLTGQALSTIGIKDENGGVLDINEEIGRQVNNLMSTILGSETWAGTKTAWNKANTIISSASQIVYTVRSIADSGREVTEWIANNTGKIGNALKRFRLVGENAYPHMSENVTHQNAWMLKVQRYREGVDSLDDAASSLQGVLGEVGNIQQEFGELNEQKQRFDKAVTDAQPKTIPDNTPVKVQRETALAISKAPADAATVFRGEGETPDAGT